MYDWIIIGGGIHGCTIANFLLKCGKTTTDQLRIIDPHPEPMSRWKRNTELIGMEFLRSPSVHHIDVDSSSLDKYGKVKKRVKEFYGRHDRPSLNLFNEHCDEVIESIHLHSTWVQGKVHSVSKEEHSWKIETTDGNKLNAKNIVIAISVNHQLNIPDWAKSVRREEGHFYHIFDGKLNALNNLPGPVTVIGGGITAAHTTILLAKHAPGQVTLLKRHPFRVHPFDSDPGWLGPKYMSRFKRVNNYDRRRTIINEARHKGSITQDLYRTLTRLEKESTISIIDGEIAEASTTGNTFILSLTDGTDVNSRSVILATGFIPSLPNEQWLKELIKQEQLQCANCGYPIVKPTLEWCNHLYVSGPLSELEVGPTARNISGARKAAERIVSSVS